MARKTLLIVPALALIVPSLASGYCQTRPDDPFGVVVLTSGAAQVFLQCIDMKGSKPGGSPDQIVDHCRLASDHRISVDKVDYEPMAPGFHTCDPDQNAWCADAAFAFDVWIGTEIADDDGAGGALTNASGRPTAFFGGPGDDRIEGTSEGDFIDGGAGNDELSGGDGDDRICTGTCDACDNGTMQVSNGGSGDDLIIGGPDDDDIHGGAGNDVLQSSGGRDRVHGGEGNDVVHGGADNDLLYGDTGADQLHGGEGKDYLYGDGETSLNEVDLSDVILAMDTEEDGAIDGGTGGAACRVDAADPTASNCEIETIDACGDSVLFAGDGGTLITIDSSTGANLGRGGVVPTAVGFAGLAVEPHTCTLWAVVEDAAAKQQLVTFGGCPDGVCKVTGAGSISGLSGAIVDIAFNAQGELHVLTKTADFARLDPDDTGGWNAHTVLPAPEWARGRDPVHLAYDDADSGKFFVTTYDQVYDAHDLDMISARGEHPTVSFTGSTQDDATEYNGEAITLHAVSAHPAGMFHAIDSFGRMWLHVRKKFAREAQMDGANQAKVPVGGDPESLTIPHW